MRHRSKQAMDHYNAQLDSITTFILPAGSRAAALLHLARAVCVAAEQQSFSLARSEPAAVSGDLLAYINR